MTVAAAAVKRVMDVIGALALLILSSPVLCIIALAIKLEDDGPIFFRQERLGRHGKVFTILKFRTMLPDAPRMPGGLAVREHDRRITRVGRLLRRFGLDEIPQAVNVLRGEMSLVGPRPALPRDLERYTRRQRRRLDVKPGLTGLAQVSGRAGIPWQERIEYDLAYVDHWSVGLELTILLRTVMAVLRRDAVYTRQDPWRPAGGTTPDRRG